MTEYARIENGAIVRILLEPSGILSSDNAEWDGRDWDFRDPSVRGSWLTSHGWVPITKVSRPADTATTTSDPAPVALVAGVPTQQWTVRPWTPEELAGQAAAAQYEADRLTVKAIVTDLRTEKARAQAVIDTPNATIKTNPAPYVVDVARAAKRIADAAIDLARYVAP